MNVGLDDRVSQLAKLFGGSVRGGAAFKDAAQDDELMELTAGTDKALGDDGGGGGDLQTSRPPQEQEQEKVKEKEQTELRPKTPWRKRNQARSVLSPYASAHAHAASAASHAM